VELRFDPKTRFELSLGDQSLTLTSPEFSALKNFLPGIKLPDETKLIGSLFQAGFLMPETHVVPGGMGAWLKTMPNANLRLIAASKDHWITGIDPAVAWFLDQDFLAMAIGLHESLRSALKRMLYGAAVREQVFPRESGLLALHEIARSWLNAHPEAKKWLEWAPANERFRLHLRALEKVRLASPEAANLRLQLEDKTETRSFPLLQKDFSEIELFLRSRENQFESPIDRFPRKMNDELRAYHLGHAGLLIDFKQTRILIDPLLPAARATFEVEPPSLREIGQIDALFLTHHHSDHCDETLLLG
jgi:hypothetical protein